mgnify:CR=1 FL=1
MPYLISGGFHCLIQSAAKELGIPNNHIFANKLKFYYDGSYGGFDEDQPTSRSGGKSVVIQRLRDDFGHSKIIMIGDGVTDLEACPPADAFIGKNHFGGYATCVFCSCVVKISRFRFRRKRYQEGSPIASIVIYYGFPRTDTRS